MPETTAQWSAVVPEMTYKKVLKSTTSEKFSKLRFGIIEKFVSNSSRINNGLRGVIFLRPFPVGTQASKFLGSS